MKNYYEILEVHPKASSEIIKKVYKIKVKQNHPDLFQGEEKNKAEELTKEITEAYDILSDKEKRENYDIELKNEEKEHNNVNKYETIIASLKSENEYLKQVIMSKNSMINDYINNEVNLNYNNNNNYISHPENINTASTDKPVNDNREYFNSILFDLKQLGFKLAVFFILLFALLMFFWAITGNNIFTILKEIL